MLHPQNFLILKHTAFIFVELELEGKNMKLRREAAFAITYSFLIHQKNLPLISEGVINKEF